MTDRGEGWYLFHYTPPVGMGAHPVLLLTSPSGDTRRIVLSELAAFKHPLVTHSFSFLVDWFRSMSLDLPIQVIDVVVAKKLLIGRPKSDFSGHMLPWDMSAIMLPYLPPEYDNPEVRRALSTHLANPTIGDLGDFRWMLSASAALPHVWQDLKRDLETARESARLHSVELPVYNVMLETQLRGIRIDTQKRDALLSEVERQYIAAHHSLAVNHGIHVTRALRDGSYLANHLRMPGIKEMTPEEIIDNFKDTEPICSKLHDLVSARRNKSILLRMLSLDQEFCYPSFDTIGTVTGRILTIDPQLQHLKKAYRSVLVPRPDTRHVYIDYSQFEPNIMASMSRDSALIDLCGGGDLYAELALRLFGNRALRAHAKTLFLSYSYGMGTKGLEAMVARLTGGDLSGASRILDEQFYGLLSGVQRWKRSLHEQLIAEGRIGTALGNYRNRNIGEGQNRREERWCVSQAIQGTGALILKQLICRISKHLPEVHILLPMHDALLIEIPASSGEAMIDQVVAEFIAVFTGTCPSVEPRVTVGPFTTSE